MLGNKLLKCRMLFQSQRLCIIVISHSLLLTHDYGRNGFIGLTRSIDRFAFCPVKSHWNILSAMAPFQCRIKSSLYEQVRPKLRFYRLSRCTYFDDILKPSGTGSPKSLQYTTASTYSSLCPSAVFNRPAFGIKPARVKPRESQIANEGRLFA